MILDLVRFISTHFQPKPSHGNPFQIHFSKIPTPIFWKKNVYQNLIFCFFLFSFFPPFFGRGGGAWPTRTHLEISNGHSFFDFLVDTLRGVDPSKKTRDVRTIHFHPFSRRDLCHVSENKGFRFVKKSMFHLKTWEWRSGRLPSANTSPKKGPLF